MWMLGVIGNPNSRPTPAPSPILPVVNLKESFVSKSANCGWILEKLRHVLTDGERGLSVNPPEIPIRVGGMT